MSLPPVSLIGTGALGGTFLKAFSRRSIEVAGLYNRSRERTELFAERFPSARRGTFPDGVRELGGLLLITVPDGAVAGTARRLAGLAGSWEGHLVAHCSGTLTAGALRPLADLGAQTASFHPLQSFTAASEPGHFEGIWFSSEGDPKGLELLEELAGHLDAHLLRVRPEQKPLIHLAAVFASNYLLALMHLAGKAGAEGEGDPERLIRALAPLMRRTAQNLEERGLEGALSGPIARGDTRTVEKHLELLESRPDLRKLYRRLGGELLELVKKSKKGMEPRTSEYLEKLLER